MSELCHAVVGLCAALATASVFLVVWSDCWLGPVSGHLLAPHMELTPNLRGRTKLIADFPCTLLYLFIFLGVW